MSHSHLSKLSSSLPLKEIGYGLVYATIGLLGMSDYLESGSANFIIGIVAMPLMFSPQGTSNNSSRFFWSAIIFGTIGIFIPVKTAIYLTLCASILMLYEQKKGKISFLPLITLLLMAPVCQNFAKIFSFPIRLWLTKMAGIIFLKIGLLNKVSGNIISITNDDFSVDPACMGLNMLITSLLCGLIIIAVLLKNKQKKLGLQWIMLILCSIIFLNIISNLFRILLLVYFKILPEKPLHEICGILCLILYVLLPSSIIIKYIINKKGTTLLPVSATTDSFYKPKKYAYAIVLLFMSVLLVRMKTNVSQNAFTKQLPQKGPYNISKYNEDILKLENESALIYIKSLKGFIYTEHNPLICWTGNGYSFDSVVESKTDNTKIFVGTLTNGTEKLYTAWWYDNGINTTSSQWFWRWEMIKGSEPYYLINITANNKSNLFEEIKRLNFIKKSILIDPKSINQKT